MQRILYALIIIIATGACKLQDQDNPLLVGTCRDGLKNQDEQDIDCGGVCMACVVDVAPGEDAWSPCHTTLERNVVYLGETRAAVTPATLNLSTPQAGSSYYSYEVAMPDNAILRIWLSLDTPPTQSRIYNLTKEPSDKLRKGFAYLEYVKGYYSEELHSGDGDKLYMTLKDNTLTFELCNIQLYKYDEYGNYGAKDQKIDGQIVYKGIKPTVYGCDGRVVANSLIAYGSYTKFAQTDVKYSAPKQGGNFYEYRVAITSSEYLYIRLAADRAPTETRVYTVVESSGGSSPKSGEAYLSYQNYSSYFYTAVKGEKLYMTVEKDKSIKFEFCDLDMYYYTTYYFPMSGIVIYEP